MKKLISTFVIATAISMPVFAEKGHEHGDSKGPVKDGMMMGQMMEHESESQKTPSYLINARQRAR